MKILIVGQWFVLQDSNEIFVPGGTEQHIYSLAKQLKKDNYDLVVLSTTRKRENIGWNLISGINTYLFHESSILYGYTIDILSFFNTLKLIKTFNPDIVNVISTRYRFASGAIVSAKIMRKKVVYIQTTLSHENGRWAFVDKAVFSKIIRCADVIISLSKEMRDIIARDLPHKDIEIIPSFIDIDYFYKTCEKDMKSLLFVGRLNKLKGIDLLIKSLSYVKLKVPDVRLHIVGDGNLRSSLEVLVLNYGLEKNVIFEGSLYGEKLVEAYSKSEIFVFPSLREGMPLVLLEAMSARLPIIAFDIGANVEALDGGKYGVLVEKEDIKGLAQKIIELLTDKELRVYYSNMSFERSKNYSQENIVQKIEDIYLRLSEK